MSTNLPNLFNFCQVIWLFCQWTQISFRLFWSIMSILYSCLILNCTWLIVNPGLSREFMSYGNIVFLVSLVALLLLAMSLLILFYGSNTILWLQVKIVFNWKPKSCSGILCWLLYWVCIYTLLCPNFGHSVGNSIPIWFLLPVEIWIDN